MRRGPMLRCVDLRCERLVDPIGLDTRAPRLTWRIDARGGETGVVQLAYRVEADRRWDSGRTEGWRQQLTYGGPPIESRETVRWRVRAWTNAGDTEWSEWATFEAGVLDPQEWVATMITAQAETPVVRFARSVSVPEDVVRAAAGHRTRRRRGHDRRCRGRRPSPRPGVDELPPSAPGAHP